jgi:tetratricopeptide (TPR) repeat protein
MLGSWWRRLMTMMVSRMIAYSWECAGCESSQEVPVWRILHAGERPDVVAPDVLGLIVVACPACGAVALIEASMLLVRPGDYLPLLIAVAGSELADPSPSSGPQLLLEAQAAGLPGDGLIGPMVPLPRPLVPLVLTRDVAADAADPERACQEIRSAGQLLSDWYRTFLYNVGASEPERRAARALHELLGVPRDDLPDFLESHPELGSEAAIAIVAGELADPTAHEDVTFLQARMQLVKGLAADQPARQAAAEYLAALDQFGRELNGRLTRLITRAQEIPGPKGIPQAREALELASALGVTEAEAELSAELAFRLLSVLPPDDQAIEEVIKLYERALSLVPEADRRHSAWVGNLAAAYHRRSIGDPAQNWEIMLRLLDSACTPAEREADPRRWAMNQTNYGLLLSERPGGASAEDLSHGIERIRAGLKERSPQRNVMDWAYSQLNLGLLHQRRAADGDLQEAERCYRQALRLLQPADQPQLWATLQNNLADVLLASDPVDAAGAVSAAEAGLGIVDPQTDPHTRARLLWTLGRAQDGRHGENSAAGVRRRREALSLLIPAQAPELYGRIGGELVAAYGRLNDWQAAADIYTGMLSAFDMLYKAQTSDAGRMNVMQSSPNLARWAAYALARAGRTEQAIEVIEHGRARQLSVNLSRETADLVRLASVDSNVADRYQEALASYRAALARATQTPPPPDAQQLVAAAESDIEHVLDQIRAIPGFEQFLRTMSVTEICRAGGGDPVIYLVSAPAGSYALIARPDTDGKAIAEAIHVPEITSVDVLRLETFDYIGDDHAPGLLLAQSTDPLRRKTLLPIALERLTEMRPLVAPIVDVLTRSSGNRAVLIPTGLLGLIPLHATPLSAEDGQVLDDIGEIHFAPSAAAFAACRTRASTSRQERFVGVANPQNSLSPLPGSQAELAAIQSLFETATPLLVARLGQKPAVPGSFNTSNTPLTCT